MTRGWIVLAALACASCGSSHDRNAARQSAAPAEPPLPPMRTTYECRWKSGPITLDGKADEPAWQRGQLIDDFRIPGPNHRRPHTATRARLLWDRNYLYFTADMDDADVIAKVTEHQGMVWTDDCFELFFKPDDAKPPYYEFEVNPLNTTLELFFPARDAGGYPKFKDTTHIQMKTSVTVRGTPNFSGDKDDGWTVEGRIPWRDFAPTGGPPKPGDVWKLNLCHCDYTSGAEKGDLSSCAPLTRGDFHHYEDYASVKFVGP